LKPKPTLVSPKSTLTNSELKNQLTSPIKSPVKIEPKMVVPAALGTGTNFNKTPREFRASDPSAKVNENGPHSGDDQPKLMGVG
jgi:hypothetical protein